VAAWEGDLDSGSTCPACGRPGNLRPHIVWFGEVPLEMARVHGVLARCGLFVAVGTSGHVYPAAGFVEAVGPGCRTLELNLERSLVSRAFQEHRTGRATERVPELVAELLGER
jgi:NAD-dependent deacetylase